MSISDLISWICLAGGTSFCIVGAIGLLRLPDVYARMHGGGITDTLGAILVLIGLMVQSGLTIVTVKLLMILALLLCTTPTATHAIAKAAFTSGLEPLLDDSESSS